MSRDIEPLYDHWQPLTQSKFNSLILDFEKYCEEGSIVIDKNGQAVPMVLNEAQAAVASLIIPLMFAPLPSPINVFIHKSRQMGITTVLLKIEQYCATRIRNLNTQHIMPTEPDAEEMSEKKFTPALQGVHPELAPTVYPIKRKFKFKDFGGTVLNSSVTFSSSEATGANKGQTNQVAILDEYATYKRVTHLERGILATLPKAGRALTCYVSTANGMNHFYDLSKVAQEPGNPHWKYLFLPWHMLKEYEMEPQGRLKSLTALTEYEMKLCDIFERCKYPVSSWARKMQFYEYVFQTEAKRDKDYMFENYPSTADESFAATGSPALPSDRIFALNEMNPSFDYVELVQRENKIDIMTTLDSTIKRYKVPVAGHKYAIWVDPADGGEANDESAAVIVDLDTMEDVCCIKERIDQNDLAETLAPLGYYYNRAEIVIERNTGQSCIDWLVKMLKYPRVRIDPFHTTSRRVEYGVYMTRPVKNEAIMRMKFLLNQYIYKDYDKDFLEQALHFTWSKTPTGMAKAEGTGGYHDDCVMARLVGVSSLDMSRWKDYKQYLEAQQNHGANPHNR